MGQHQTAALRPGRRAFFGAFLGAVVAIAAFGAAGIWLTQAATTHDQCQELSDAGNAKSMNLSSLDPSQISSLQQEISNCLNKAH